MNKPEYIIKQWPAGESTPWPLLLDADPHRGLVETYLKTGQLWGLQVDQNWIGVYVLEELTEALAEIKNVAVLPAYQGQGWGTRLLHHAIAQAREQGFTTLRIATADASTGQQQLYRRLGFAEHHKVPDHFITQYPEPLFENGIRCRDQIVLQMAL